MCSKIISLKKLLPYWSHEISFSPVCTLWCFLRLNLCNSHYTDHMPRNVFTTMCLFKCSLCTLLSVKVSSHWLHWKGFYCVWPQMAHKINVLSESFLYDGSIDSFSSVAYCEMCYKIIHRKALSHWLHSYGSFTSANSNRCF